MPDFSNFRKQEIKADQLAQYTFHDLEGSPSIWSLPALEANKPFMNETLRRVAARNRARRPGRVATVETMAQSRNEDRELLAKFCARNWDVVDASGERVEFSAENCLEFFQALPDDIFDGYRNWAVDPANWRHLDVTEASELGES